MIVQENNMILIPSAKTSSVSGKIQNLFSKNERKRPAADILNERMGFDKTRACKMRS